MTTNVKRHYTRSSTAWPRHIWTHDDNTLVEQLQLAGTDFGGFDFGMTWHRFDGHGANDTAVRLEAFEDSWRAVIGLGLVQALEDLRGAAGAAPTVAQVVTYLERIGFTPSEYDGALLRREKTTEKGPRS